MYLYLTPLFQQFFAEVLVFCVAMQWLSPTEITIISFSRNGQKDVISGCQTGTMLASQQMQI